MSSSIASFFSSFISTTYADAEEQSPADAGATVVEQEAEKEEEEEEPEDIQPVLREECKQSAKCAALTKHFEHCQEKVESGQGFKGEDCVEEFMMHCVDECAGPKLFSKLR
ncbi:Non-heme 11 kDa protein of cytochrome bc1 complex [Pholiota molesta]|nr:Non-heme 11 kDa protein of cytochrome bc1 complex [Pholiota molesta]KAF8170582.1 Non-heme 11 kDa protein of cytochrome bc1 complex [Pholiota molesta]